MMSGFEAWLSTLATAGQGWRDQQQTLRDARADLVAAEGRTASMGERVAPAADAFFATWVEHVKGLAEAAERHADALETSAQGYEQTDQVQHERLAAMLPWDQRGERPPPPPLPPGVR